MTAVSESPLLRADSAARLLSAKISRPPLVALILGSGLSGVVDSIRPDFETSTADLLGTASASVAGHSGKVIIGTLAGIRLVVFLGRIHLYEGHSAEEQTLPVLLSSRLGARILLLTNASGGIAPDMRPGDLMVIADQINMTGKVVLPPGTSAHPAGRDVYDRDLADRLHQAAVAMGVPVHKGVYAGGLGPSYETASEIRMLRRIGADAVGMSTVLEAMAGKRLGMQVAGISVITNLATGISSARLSHEEVTAGAASAGESLRRVLQEFLKGLPATP
jgi:purine-nucleoside phosphorylase